MRSWVVAFVGLTCAGPLEAGELAVRVTDQRGIPTADAIVTVAPSAGTEMPSAIMHPAARSHVIDQKNETFIPYIEVFRAGDSVVFRNSDRTRHHVYSFAPTRQFEFLLSPGESSQSLELDKAGVVAVGCNIHDQMITYLYVTDAPLTARSDKDGRARIDDLPVGAFEVRAWQPLQRSGGADNVQHVTIAAGDRKDLTFALVLLPDPRVKIDRERVSY